MKRPGDKAKFMNEFVEETRKYRTKAQESIEEILPLIDKMKAGSFSRVEHKVVDILQEVETLVKDMTRSLSDTAEVLGNHNSKMLGDDVKRLMANCQDELQTLNKEVEFTKAQEYSGVDAEFEKPSIVAVAQLMVALANSIVRYVNNVTDALQIYPADDTKPALLKAQVALTENAKTVGKIVSVDIAEVCREALRLIGVDAAEISGILGKVQGDTVSGNIDKEELLFG